MAMFVSSPFAVWLRTVEGHVGQEQNLCPWTMSNRQAPDMSWASWARDPGLENIRLWMVLEAVSLVKPSSVQRLSKETRNMVAIFITQWGQGPGG